MSAPGGFTPCVPNPCELIDNEFICGTWCNVKDRNLTVNSLYSATYIASQVLPQLWAGLGDSWTEQLGFGLLKIAALTALPLLLSMTVLIIVLVQASVISYEVGIMLFAVLLVTILVAIIWIATLAGSVAGTFVEEARSTISDNWDLYGTEIAIKIYSGLVEPDLTQCYVCPPII